MPIRPPLRAATLAFERASVVSANLKYTPKLCNPRHPESTLPYPTTLDHFETWHELANLLTFFAPVVPFVGAGSVIQRLSHYW